jgi:phospholipase C
MAFKNSTSTVLQRARAILAFAALMQSFFGPLVESARADDNRTRTPIKHVIIIVGENRTFDHIFATYKPKPGESVNNLLSEGIVNEDGTNGPNYSQAQQYSADITGSPVYEPSPTTGKTL